MENAVTESFNTANERHDISCCTRSTKVCTCQVYTDAKSRCALYNFKIKNLIEYQLEAINSSQNCVFTLNWYQILIGLTKVNRSG